MGAILRKPRLSRHNDERAYTRAMQVVVEGSGRLLAHRVETARTFRQRLLGLLAGPPPAPGEGLLLSPCSSIHTLGMGFPIDVLLLDREGRVLRALPALPPWRIPWPAARTRMVLELGTGSLARAPVEPGDRLAFRPLDRARSLR